MITVTYGAEGYAVKLLQYALSRAGLEPGRADGIFGRRTLKALQLFQREQGLCADGIAGKLTWAAVYPYITGYTLIRTDHGETNTLHLDLPVVSDQLPYSYLLTSLVCKGLTMRYPFLKTGEIGRSVMGRPIIEIRIGSGATRVGYIGPHHADAWDRIPSMLRFLEGFAKGYTNEEAWVRDLSETTTIHMVPLLNPDGVDLVNGVLDPSDSFYAQAQALAAYYPDIPFPDGWRSNISGVDLALQYPNTWEKKRRIRFARGYTRPGPRDYVGSEPLIAPESRAVERWTRDHDFDCILSCDQEYTDWFTASRDRPGYTLSGQAGEERFILAHAQTYNP